METAPPKSVFRATRRRHTCNPTKHNQVNHMIRVTIHYQSSPAQLDITQAEFDLITTTSIHSVTLIKFIRSQYGLGLYDAKSIVDTVRRTEQERLAHVAKFQHG